MKSVLSYLALCSITMNILMDSRYFSIDNKSISCSKNRNHGPWIKKIRSLIEVHVSEMMYSQDYSDTICTNVTQRHRKIPILRRRPENRENPLCHLGSTRFWQFIHQLHHVWTCLIFHVKRMNATRRKTVFRPSTVLRCLYNRHIFVQQQWATPTGKFDLQAGNALFCILLRTTSDAYRKIWSSGG
jgi:hypothetical protein